ncbi:MAG: hypothetical protein V8T48_04480 [Oscillospiraceae bacterium]
MIQRTFLFIVDTSFPIILWRCAGVSGFDADADQTSDFAGQGGNGILGASMAMAMTLTPRLR